MKLSHIKDPMLREKLVESMRRADLLAEQIKRECPYSHESKSDDQIPSSKPEQTVLNEPLAENAGEKEGSKRIVVRVTSYRNRLCDIDNLCVKAIVDSLRYCGLIEDDRPEDIELHVAQDKCSRKDERTEIELEYPC